MSKSTRQTVDYRSVELDGIRYVILREAVFELLCQKARVSPEKGFSKNASIPLDFDLDRSDLAEKLIRRRRAAGLAQAELARRAGVRPETLNRIERGRTTPDFATIRKLVIAINEAEQEQASQSIS